MYWRPEAKSGMKDSRHLWNFLTENLNPNCPLFEFNDGAEIFALSTDLEEATDYGNPSVAR
jgi:hypothetical protein